MQIPIARPAFDSRDRERILEPLDDGWVVQGPRVQQFEALFSEFTGCQHAVACSSGTSALHLALEAMNIGPGDDVIVPSFTWVATANAVVYCGARPVLCDVDPITYNLNAEHVEAVLTKKTRAIIPVHLFGKAAPMAELETLIAGRRIGLIEDAACAFGTFIGSTHAGTVGDFGTFSFHPRKAITTGEGGMVLARSPEHIRRLRALRDHGAERVTVQTEQLAKIRFDHLGFNYRMTDIQGALGCGQMDKADWILGERQKRARRYWQALARFPSLRPPEAPENETHAFQAYVCSMVAEQDTSVDEMRIRRDSLMIALKHRGVSTRPGTHAVHTLGYYRDRFGYQDGDLPGANWAQAATIALPLYPQMTDEEQDYVVEMLGAALDEIASA